jgi:hypothetical protein
MRPGDASTTTRVADVRSIAGYWTIAEPCHGSRRRQVTETTPNAESGDLKALTSALDHARSMANQAAEVRMRNFNFFIVITGALVAGYGRPAWAWNVMASLFFLGLDVRGYGLQRRSVDQLTILEPLLWERGGIPGWTAIPRHGGLRIISHRWIYQTFCVIVGTAWATALTINLLGR